MQHIAVLGVSHRTAPLRIREKLSFTERQSREALRLFRERFAESVILFTCNRTEVYAVSSDKARVREALLLFFQWSRDISPFQLEPYIFNYTGEEAIHHLFKVASGLDSMVLGETQILGQVKEAYGRACEEDAVGKTFHSLFQQSFKTGKRVHTETGINDNASSLSYVAVKLARELFGDLKGRSVMVLGAGKMSELTLQHLWDHGAHRVLVANRTRERARSLAERFQGTVIDYKEMQEGLKSVDIVITSTGAPHQVVHAWMVDQAMRERKGRELLLVDLAVPRDVEPEAAKKEEVHLYDLDGLQKLAEANRQERYREASRAEEMVEEERKSFTECFHLLQVEPYIAALRRKGEGIYLREKEQALSRVGHLSEKEKKTVETMGLRIMNQLLKDPVLYLKEASRRGQGEDTATILQSLFSLEGYMESEISESSKEPSSSKATEK